MDYDTKLREHLVGLLIGGEAHLDFERAFADVPAGARGQRFGDLPHTLWRLLEHMRIAQWDILQFSRDPQHVSPNFPEGYWPAGDGPENDAQWNASLDAFRADLDAMRQMVADPTVDLYAPIPHGDGQTILREALLVADHNAYHLGQVVTLRRVLGIWND